MTTYQINLKYPCSLDVDFIVEGDSIENTINNSIQKIKDNKYDVSFYSFDKIKDNLKLLKELLLPALQMVGGTDKEMTDFGYQKMFERWRHEDGFLPEDFVPADVASDTRAPRRLPPFGK